MQVEDSRDNCFCLPPVLKPTSPEPGWRKLRVSWTQLALVGTQVLSPAFPLLLPLPHCVNGCQKGQQSLGALVSEGMGLWEQN